MVKNILLTLLVLPASVFSIIILMNNPQPVGLVIVFLSLAFISLVIYMLFLNRFDSNTRKKAFIKNKNFKNHR
jgi:hypothetical protein